MHRRSAITWSRARGLDLLALAGIAIATLVAWYFRILRPAHIPFDLMLNADFFTQIYPMWLRTAEWWRDGVVPLWNPYQYAGQPLLATGIYGVLYPPNVLYWFVPAEIAIEVLSVVHLAIAGMSMYAYARTIGLGRRASFVAGATFMLSGFVTSQATWFPPALAAGVWLPLALLALERLFRRVNVASALLLALAVAIPFLGGWPQTWLYSMYVFAVYGFGRFLVATLSAAERPRLLRASVLAVGAMLVAVAWMAPQLLPSLELQALGPRRGGALTILQIMPYGSLGPSALLASMLDAVPGRPRWAYVGMGALLLMPLSLVAARQRWRVACFWLLAAFSLCVATGFYTPVLELYKLLGGSVFRAPQRVLYIYAAVAAILAGVGFDVVARLADAPRSRGVPWLSSPRLLFLALATVAVVASVGFALIPMPALSRFYLVATLALVSGALLAPWEPVRRVLVHALAASMVADLVVSLENPFLHPIHRPRVFDAQKSAFDFIEARQGLDRTYIMAAFEFPELMSKQGSLREIYSITDYEPLSLSRYDRFFRILEAPRDRRPAVLTFTGTLHADPARPQFRLLDLLSVRFVVVPNADIFGRQALARLAPKWQLTRVTREGCSIYENTDPLPRAYVAQNTIVAPSEDAAFAATTDATFDPRTSVVIEAEGTAVDVSAAPTTIVPARIVRHEPTRVDIEAVAPADGWLVLTDTHYPGWQATVDGVSTPIVRANFLFRAVPIPAGTHRVEFTYRPGSFWLGAAAALVALVVTLLAIALESRKRARGRAPRSV